MFNIGQDFYNYQLKDAIAFVKEQKAFIRILDNGLYRIGSIDGISSEEKESSCRLIRDFYLKETDFTQSADSPFSKEEKTNYANYRKYLRKFPESPEFPNEYPLSFDEWN